MEVLGGTEKTGKLGKASCANGSGRIRLRAMQAALSAALLEAIPGGSEVAQFVGIDPVAHAKRRMLNDLGKDAGHDCSGGGSSAKALPRAAGQVTRGLVRVAKGALKGTRYAAILAKRGAVIITVVSSVTSGISAYRELTAVGFAALSEG